MPLAIQTQVVGGGGDGLTKTVNIRKPDQVRITQSRFVPGRKQNAKKLRDKDHEHRSTTWGQVERSFKVGPDFIDEEYFECTPLPLYEQMVPMPDYKTVFETPNDEVIPITPVKPQPTLDWDPNLSDVEEQCFLEELERIQNFPNCKFAYMLPPQSRQDSVRTKLVKIFKPGGDYCVNTKIYIDLEETPSIFIFEITGSLVIESEEKIAETQELNEKYLEMVERHLNRKLFASDNTQTFETFKMSKYTDNRIKGCADVGVNCEWYQIVDTYRIAASDDLHQRIRENDDLIVGFFVEKARQDEKTKRMLVEKTRQDAFNSELFSTKFRLDELKAGLLAARVAQEDTPGCGGGFSGLPPEKARIEELTARLLEENERQQDMAVQLIDAKARQNQLTKGLLPRKAQDMYERLLADQNEIDYQPGGIFAPKPTLEELIRDMKRGKSKEEKLLLVEKAKQDELTTGMLSGKELHDKITDGLLAGKILQDELDVLLVEKAIRDEDEDLIRRVEFTRYKDADDIREFLMEEASDEEIPQSSEEEDEEFEVRLTLKEVHDRKRRKAKHGLRLCPDISLSIPPLEEVIFADLEPEPEPEEEERTDCVCCYKPLELSMEHH